MKFVACNVAVVELDSTSVTVARSVIVRKVTSYARVLSVLSSFHSNGQFLWCCLFNMLYKVVLTFESVDEILKCDHSNKSY